MEGRRLNLLCIDGGGIKGLSALYIIRKLMEFIDHDNPPKPCKVFDMIGGTSTGGLIAVMLGRLDMTVDECIEQYRTLQNNVFHEMNKIERSSSTQGRYDHVALEEAVKVLLRSRGRHENELLKNLDENGCKVFVTVTNSGSSTAEVIASYYRRRGSAEVWNIAKIWEAIRATSAAPDLFAPINIGIRRYLGGGTGANNPVSVMWREASDHFCSDGSLEDELNCLVSIGSGIKSLTRFGESTSALRRTLAAIATETEATARGFLDTRFALFDAGIYHRFSAPSVGDVAIEKPEDTSVVQMTDHYISGNETQDRMLICSAQLVKRHVVTGSYHVSAQKSSRDQHGSNDPRQSKQALARNKRYSRNIMRHKNASRKEVFDMPEHISTYLADRTKKRLGSARHPDTTNWIFDNENFRQWLENESGSCFALTGIIGSGKTTCTTNVIDFLQHWSKSHRRQVFHFFYETLIPQRLLGVHALEAFLKQMILLNPELPKDLQQRLEDYYGPEPSRPPIEQLGTDLILPLIRCLRNPIFVIDGLDECEQNSRQDLIEILSPIVAEGSLLFISTRDASDLSSRFPHLLTAQCSTRESGVRHDLDIFISSLIHQQNTRRILTKDQEVLKTIKTTLLEKAGSMFLWVKLLVLDLWSECSDTGIEDYLANRLPADLEETYARCMRRVHPSRVELSTDMFRLVCSAVEPFNINELCAMLTLSMKAAQQNGCLVFKRAEPLPEVLIRDCGVHLVAVDECGLVLPVHHSVQQHVFPKKFVPYGEDSALQWQRIVAELNIGMICMLLIQQHLDQALVRRRSKYNNLSVMHFQPLTVFNHISSIFGDRDQPKQIPGPSLFTSSAAESMRSQVLLAYAQRSWIQSNRQIGRIVHFSLTKALPSSWPLFMKLTSEQHENVSFPWPRFETNHLHGLFVWAVTHNHVPLIDVLKQPCCSETVKKLDLFNKPLLPPNQGFALHHAAQSGDERFFRVLWTVVDIWKADLDGNTALHIGARTGNGFATRSYRLIESFPNKIGSVSLRKSKTQIFERSSATPLTNSALQNPLHMAVMGGRVDCVRDAIGLAIALMGVMLTEVTETTRPAFLHGEHLWIYHTDVDGNMPLDYAIMTGSVKFLESCLACFAEAKLNHVRYDGLLLTKAIKLQKWDHAIFLVENKSIDISYPFDTSHPLPDPDLPVARSLFEAIVVARPVWIPMLLEDAWRVGTIAKEGWHDWLMSLHLLPRRDDLDLKLFTLCQIIHRTRADEPFYYNRRVIPPHWLPGLDMEWSKLAQIPDRNWESVVVAEAVATKNHHILHIILDLRCQLQPYVLYSAARSGDIYAIDLLLELRDAAWAAAIHRESAARIAERHGNVHAFLKLRGDDQFPTISREWLLSIDDFIFFCLQKEQDILLPLIASVEGDRIADRMLWYASALGVTDLAIKMLDERAAYINYQGKDSTTALWQAAYSASWNLVIALLLRGADATIAAGGSGLSPKEPFEGSRPNITDRDMEEARTPRELALFLHGPGERDTVHWRAIMKLEDREAGSCRPPTIVLTPAF